MKATEKQIELFKKIVEEAFDAAQTDDLEHMNLASGLLGSALEMMTSCEIENYTANKGPCFVYNYSELVNKKIMFEERAVSLKKLSEIPQAVQQTLETYVLECREDLERNEDFFGCDTKTIYDGIKWFVQEYVPFRTKWKLCSR